MVELTYERIDKILHEETLKTEDSRTIQRALYNRNMYLYEKYLSDIDALNDETIAELKKYHEETKSLMKYYRMDIPQDTSDDLDYFNKKFTDRILGPDWHDFLFSAYEEFKDDDDNDDKSEECLKKEFEENVLVEFYERMDDVFRDGFGTSSQTANDVFEGAAAIATNFFKS